MIWIRNNTTIFFAWFSCRRKQCSDKNLSLGNKRNKMYFSSLFNLKKKQIFGTLKYITPKVRDFNNCQVGLTLRIRKNVYHFTRINHISDKRHEVNITSWEMSGNSLFIGNNTYLQYTVALCNTSSIKSYTCLLSRHGDLKWAAMLYLNCNNISIYAAISKLVGPLKSGGVVGIWLS